MNNITKFEIGSELVNVKVGDLIEKAVKKGYSTGIEEHVETYEVVLIEALGAKGVVWAMGHVVATTDGRGEGLGKRSPILPVNESAHLNH
ncbi:hypothetical protein QDW36_gp34 [Microbacterium phage Avocadoman]|uniref:hypothetical protein n=1 Tax=Microbacterium phage Doobus TaxID=2871539 RepID=UPI0018A44333|nr:hypothetical protein QDW33_gp34 [Microbacterium phage Doobus]YP_010753323.1 hypothetical protein QDW36_gp34 [Microbacterium phage Avocadoman]QOP64863.1 hypothetical protein SEA_AVOCADOMAN_34 [Microbacterium phage Avocadoman]QZE10254.1 hypothetical protein SEA_DOOBUS_34 [Microbacterium phage Doobus]